MENFNQTCLEPYFASFEESLSSKNYTPNTLKTCHELLRRFGRGLEAEGITLSALTPDIAAEIGRRIPSTPKGQIKVSNLAKKFVAHITEIGIVARALLTSAQAERYRLQDNFKTYLLQQRGLTSRSTYHVLRFTDRFLNFRFDQQMLDLSALNSRDITAFLTHLYSHKPPFRDKTPASHLRTFLQYLFAQGLIPTNLSLSIPRVHQQWAARLPRYLSPDQIETVLASVRTNPCHGTRNSAILLLIAQLGLRAPEIIALQLDDIDWRAGELLVRGKGQRHGRLPLPPDVGEAISQYLQEGRTSLTTGRLFVTYRAPNRPPRMVRASTIY